MGFDPALADRIFQPFMRLHPGAGIDGSGMGLAIVAKAIDQLGWTIAVDTVEGEGTRFLIRIPGEQIVTAPATD